MPAPDLTLILDTTLPEALLALHNSSTDMLWEHRDDETRSSERLHSHLNTLLMQSNATLSDVNRIIVTTGPGSFTGIRVGLAIAQALQLANNATIHPLTTFEALRLSAPIDGPATVLIDSLGQEVYLQHFDNGTPQGAPLCVAAPEISGHLRTNAALIGNGAAQLGRKAVSTSIAPKTLISKDIAAQTPTPLYLKPLNYRKITQK